MSAANEDKAVSSSNGLAEARSINFVSFSMVEAHRIMQAASDAAGLQSPITFDPRGWCPGGHQCGFDVLWHGMTRDFVLGLEAILPDGRIWRGMDPVPADQRHVLAYHAEATILTSLIAKTAASAPNTEPKLCMGADCL